MFQNFGDALDMGNIKNHLTWYIGIRIGLATRWKRDVNSHQDSTFLKEKEVILCEMLHKCLNDGKPTGDYRCAIDMSTMYQASQEAKGNS